MRRCNVWSVLAISVTMVSWSGRDVRGDDKELDLLVAGQSDELVGWEFFAEKDGTPVSDVWTLRDGILTCQGTPKGYLYTSKDYQDFVLTLQWRWVPEEKPDKKPGNGGVLIRMTGSHKIWPKSLEAQINAGQAGDFWGLGGFGLEGPAERMKSVDGAQLGKLTHVARQADAERPAGQWNDYEIIATAGTVTLKINGQQVNEATRCDVVPGKICLTAEGDMIQFRNVRLVAKEKK